MKDNPTQGALMNKFTAISLTLLAAIGLGAVGYWGARKLELI